MFGLIWIPWILVVAILLFAHHVPWWVYVVIAITVCADYPTGSARAAAKVIGWERLFRAKGPWFTWYQFGTLAWLVVAAGIFYRTHLAWWVYLILVTAVWIGASMGYVAKETELEHYRGEE